jgi:hypothetical protein
MKFSVPSRRRLFVGFTGLVLLSGSIAPLLRADKKAEPVIEHKDYTLFMGADFKVEKDHKMYSVVDVVGGSFVILVKGERVLIPVDKKGLMMRVDNDLRITPEEISVRHLTNERAYTPANDPRRYMQGSLAMMDVSDLDLARSGAANAQNTVTQLTDHPSPYMSPQARQTQLAAATSQNQLAQSTLSRLSNQAQDMQFGNGAYEGRVQDELAKGLYDAEEIDFKVSSPKRLERPYLIFVVTYRGPDDAKGIVRNWIFGKQLDPIGPAERHEHFLQGGLTPGFTVLSTEFHLYNEGKELATEVSHKRVALTRDEAYEYSTIEYMAAHKKDSAAPVPAMGVLPKDFLVHLSQDEVQGTFFAKVDADGKVRDVYKDEACKMKVDNTYLSDGLKSIRFEPAIEKGKAVEGIAKIHPNRIHYVLEVKT